MRGSVKVDELRGIPSSVGEVDEITRGIVCVVDAVAIRISDRRDAPILIALELDATTWLAGRVDTVDSVAGELERISDAVSDCGQVPCRGVDRELRAVVH